LPVKAIIIEFETKITTQIDSFITEKTHLLKAKKRGHGKPRLLFKFVNQKRRLIRPSAGRAQAVELAREFRFERRAVRL
jgi:hypothetical protein